MFSGIVEAQSRMIKTEEDGFADKKIIRIFVSRPTFFTDLKIGDSICVNGICLTLEKFDSEQMQFCLGAETLQVLTTSFAQWVQLPLNLERSLKFGDRMHGHLVSGHVDGVGAVVESYADGDCWQIKVQIPSAIQKFFWKKGSVSLNGVSLTVNEVEKNIISVCLIPETIKATQLSLVGQGQFMNIEADYLAKAYIHSKEGQ